MKEYTNRDDLLGSHCAPWADRVAVAFFLTLIIGLPLGWATHRRLCTGLFPYSTSIQAVHRAVWPVDGAAGFDLAASSSQHLVTWASVAWFSFFRNRMALTLYSLLPVVRGTHGRG
jgi:ABC-type proline/glycine betaine transport system permease subunit